MHLQKIIDYKRQELESRRRQLSLKDVRKKAGDIEPARDFLGALLRASGGRFPSEGSGVGKGETDGGLGGRAVSPPAIIAEVKKASPSAGVIRPDFDPLKIAQLYQDGGAAALSVLTDERFFQGSLENLEKIRAQVGLPCLRKDFTLADYHVYEARASGADAVLLIVRVLEDAQLKDYAALARDLGMAALVEVHDASEMERAKKAGAGLIGINNRNLDTFQVDLQTAIRLAKEAPQNAVLVAESGILGPEDIQKLTACGIHAFLIGEALMRSADPVRKLRELLLVASGRGLGGV